MTSFIPDKCYSIDNKDVDQEKTEFSSNDILSHGQYPEENRWLASRSVSLPWQRVIFLVLAWHAHLSVAFSNERRFCSSMPKSCNARAEHHVTRYFPNDPNQRRGDHQRFIKLASSQRSVGTEYNQSSLQATDAVNNNDDTLLLEMKDRKRNALSLLGEGRLPEVLQITEEMLDACQRVRLADPKSENPRIQRMSEFVDDVFQAFAMVAFVPIASRTSKPQQRRLELGMRALQLQLSSSSSLTHPYDTIPKPTLLMALRTLTTYMEVHGNELITCSSPLDTNVESDACTVMDTSDAAFRILQRLVTGVGVRPSFQQGGRRQRVMAEKDFHRVLIAFSKVGKVSEAHRMVKLQERHAGDFWAEKPAVAYSILLKGYGRLRNVENVEKTLANFCQQLQSRNDVEPDIIFLNSLIDAFINCRALNKAQDLFEYMKQHSTLLQSEGTASSFQPSSPATNDYLIGTPFSSLFLGSGPCPAPNKRTYNTMLKGYAENGSISQAMSLAREMEQLRLWDAVTTNTLVHAAVQSGELELAESILGNYTMTTTSSSQMSGGWEKGGVDSETAPGYTKGDQTPAQSRTRSKQFPHPNVEAYTELLDAYGKSSQLEKAMSIMQLMRRRGVEPNEFTYTCAIGALARHRKIDQAHRLLAFMESTACNVRLTAVTYNSFISGLVASSQMEGDDSEFDDCVDEAMHLLQRMMEKGINPNAITISVLIESFGRCQEPRVEEAKALVQKLEQSGIITRTNPRVATSLIRTCGLGGDLKGAAEAFRKMTQPDVAALNAFLDACCRYNMLNMALQTFEHFFQRKKDSPPPLFPDVITYSVLIAALLNSKTLGNAHRAQQMYTEMKCIHIWPDRFLIDVILKAMVKSERPGLSKEDVVFLVSVLRDAESLPWEEGQLDRRKRAVRAVIVSRISELGKEKKELLGMLDFDSKGAEEDELFLRKGWNKVDSSFRLWSYPAVDDKPPIRETKKRRKEEVDEFFESKGWNIFSSGFRII